MFRPVDPQVSFPKLEEELIAWWRESGVRARAIPGRSDGPDFIFFEGPPTANGMPGVHHVLARAFKDIILRYKRMRGFHIIGARGGWDTQGLPVEIGVEKELGLSGKREIEDYGIAAFNDRCKASVFRYVKDWERMTDRIAYWIDLDDAYITYTNVYLESCWWIMRKLWDDGLLVRDYKVTMHCPRCVTTLSDAEVAQGYKEDTEDPSIWPMFRVMKVDGGYPEPLAGLPGEVYFLAWTTTPWTLPANVAVALKPDGVYVAAHPSADDSRILILAEALLEANLGTEAVVLRRFTGDDLAGIRYEPLYRRDIDERYLIALMTRNSNSAMWDGAEEQAILDGWRESVYKSIIDQSTLLSDGTGIVHIAPAYGDLEIGRKHNLPTLFSVDLNGNVMPELAAFAGQFFKEADPHIIHDLKERGLMFRSGRTKHTYPFCWRCDTPLLFYAKSSWYIRTTARKDRLVEGNRAIHWYPEYIRDGRFGNWLENNVDWAISRERYWGTPLPIWECDCGHQECVGSIAELGERTGRDLSGIDLHRPFIDDIVLTCPECGGEMHRLPDVLDAWFDSGAMPVAQWHYPFENADLFARVGEADFISEAVDQTRGWFYSLHALATLLFDRPAFSHVICLGHIQDEKGYKMSKSKGNVVDPWSVLDVHGADALRWYLYTCTTPGNPRRFSANLVGESVRKFLLTLWNTYSFFVTYANLDGWTTVGAGLVPARQSDAANPFDRWALSRLQTLVTEVTDYLEDYGVTEAARAIESFVDNLSNWYLRRNRRRFWKSEADEDKAAAYATLHTCLVTVAKLMAPFAPFVSEAIYRNLTEAARRPSKPATTGTGAAESVHLADWPVPDAALIDERLNADMAVLIKVVELGRSARSESGLKVRQPLAEMLVHVPGAAEEAGLKRFMEEVKDELNVKTVSFMKSSGGLVEYHLKPNLPIVGRKYGKVVPAMKRMLESLPTEAAAQIAAAARAGKNFQLTVEGEALTLQPDEVLIESSSPSGFAVAEEGGYAVALNTEISEELRREGLARDLVRNVQDARKSAGLAISDRVTLWLDAPEAVANALADYLPYLMAETLADSVTFAPPPAHAHCESADMGGASVIIGIRVV